MAPGRAAKAATIAGQFIHELGPTVRSVIHRNHDSAEFEQHLGLPKRASCLSRSLLAGKDQKNPQRSELPELGGDARCRYNFRHDPH
jgi:hypothetical protein